MKKRKNGYTIVEVTIAIISLVVLAAFVLGVYAMIHFIAKFW